MTQDIYIQKLPKESLTNLEQILISYTNLDGMKLEAKQVEDGLNSGRVMLFKDSLSTNKVAMFLHDEYLIMAPIRHTKEEGTNTDLYYLQLSEKEEIFFKRGEAMMDQESLRQRVNTIISKMPEHIINLFLESGSIEDFEYGGLKVLNHDMPDTQIEVSLKEGEVLYVEDSQGNESIGFAPQFMLIPSGDRVTFVPCFDYDGTTYIHFGHGKNGPFVYRIANAEKPISDATARELRNILEVIDNFVVE